MAKPIPMIFGGEMVLGRSNVNVKSSDDDLMVIASTYPLMVGKRSSFGRLSKRVFVRARVDDSGKLEFFVDPADLKYLR